MMNPSRAALLGLVLLGLLLGTTAATAAVIPPFKAHYTLRLGPMELAEMSRRLYINDQGNYVFESHSRPKGYARWLTDSELRESSEWQLYKNRPRPLHYTYDRSGKKKRHVELNFDWQRMRVTNNINNDPWKMPITDNTQDKLLYHLSVMLDLKQGKTNPSYEIADGGTLKTVRFIYEGEERLKTKLGTLNTIKMYHPGKKKENDTWLWFAPELNYLPVQIQQKKSAGTVMMTIQSVEGIKPTPAIAATRPSAGQEEQAPQ